MPRNLARLKFRAPKAVRPLDASRLPLLDRRTVEREVRQHVVQLSKPATALSLQTVVSSQWKDQPGKPKRKRALQPHTLKDIVDPEAKAKHGEIIYVFRNIKTNQVIYSLGELLDNHHLEQLPFIGKHSKPPAIRHDEWTPHCVVTFPSAAQGLHAFRKLREFRKLHELSWDKTSPEWMSISKEERMKKIMDQVAFTSADLAEVLRIQEKQAEWMQQKVDEHEAAALKFMDKEWPELEMLANASLAKEKRNADNTKWLEHQIKSLTYQLGLKTNQNEADQKRLKTAKRSHEVRLRKILTAQRKAEQFKNIQAKLLEEAAPAMQPNATARLEGWKEKVRQLEDAVADPDHNPDQVRFYKTRTIPNYKSWITSMEKAMDAKSKAENEGHYITRSILPLRLRNPPPAPFSMNVEIRWADLMDAEYAAGKWPTGVTNDVLPLNAAREGVQFLNAAEYHTTVEDDVQYIVNRIKNQALDEARKEGGDYVPESAPAPAEKTGILKYLKNPFRRAEA